MSFNDVSATVVTLIGSTKFKEDFERIAKWYTMNNCLVLHTPYFSHADGEELSDATVKKLYEISKERIKASKLVVVVNKLEYIGESTYLEILYAMIHQIPVVYAYSQDVAMKNIQITNQNECLTIYAPRQTGSTNLLLMLAEDTHIPIIVKNRNDGQHLFKQAKHFGIELPEVYVRNAEFGTIEQVVPHRESNFDDRHDDRNFSAIDEVLLDDANMNIENAEFFKNNYTVRASVFKIDTH